MIESIGSELNHSIFFEKLSPDSAKYLKKYFSGQKRVTFANSLSKSKIINTSAKAEHIQHIPKAVVGFFNVKNS